MKVDDVKNLILDKAKERMDRFGFKKTTMDEISRDCKISKKTIYGHFKDKEDMFTCLLMRECRKSREIIFSRMGKIADPLERFIQLIRTALSILVKIISSPDYLKMMMRYSRRSYAKNIILLLRRR